MKKILLVVSLLSGFNIAVADDIAAGEALYNSRGCVGCHGAKGNSMIPMNPILQGQHAQYLISALNAYKSGTRNNPVMQGMIATLNDDQIKKISAYLAAQ